MRFCTKHNHLFAAQHRRAYVCVYNVLQAVPHLAEIALLYTIHVYLLLLLNVAVILKFDCLFGFGWFSIFFLFRSKIYGLEYLMVYYVMRIRCHEKIVIFHRNFHQTEHGHRTAMVRVCDYAHDFCNFSKSHS